MHDEPAPVSPREFSHGQRVVLTVDLAAPHLKAGTPGTVLLVPHIDFNSVQFDGRAVRCDTVRTQDDEVVSVFDVVRPVDPASAALEQKFLEGGMHPQLASALGEALAPKPLSDADQREMAYAAWLESLDESVDLAAREEADKAAANERERIAQEKREGAQLRDVLKDLGFDPGELDLNSYIAPDGVRYQLARSGTSLLVFPARYDRHSHQNYTIVELGLHADYTAARRAVSLRTAITEAFDVLAEREERARNTARRETVSPGAIDPF